MKLSIELPQDGQKDPSDPCEAYETMTQIAQEAERRGFHSIWLLDHVQLPSSLPIREQILFECWMSTAALARDTTQIRIGQLVTSNGFRHPALVAKMAGTVDVLSHGRLTLGIGAGWYEQEYRAYGYAFPGTATRLRQLREALCILKAMWSEDEAVFEGQYLRVQGAINQPKGTQKPHIPLLIGGKGEQVTLKLVARYADACNFTHPTQEELARKHALLKRYCEEVGRNEHDIHHTIYVNGAFGETEAEASARLATIPGNLTLDHICTRGLFGTPEMVRQRLWELEQSGVQEVILSRRSLTSPEALDFFAQFLS